MKIKQLKLIFISMLLSSILPIHANQAPIIVGGVMGYMNPSNPDPDAALGSFPTIATYQNNQWIYALDYRLAPADYDPFYYTPTLSAIDCHEDTCVTAGYYQTTTTNEFPMVSISHDKGLTWEYVIDSSKNLPTDFNLDGDRGRLQDATCTAEGCYAIGTYTSATAKAAIPVIFHNTRDSSTWDNTTLLPADATSRGYSLFNKMSCTNDYCVFVGTYITQEYDAPMILTKTNDTWAFTLDSKNPPKDFFIASDLADISCTENICVVVGSYVDKNHANTYQRSPLVAVSFDNGTTWEYQDIFEPGTLSELLSVSCQDDTCVVAGNVVTSGYGYPSIVKGKIINGNQITWTTTYTSDKTSYAFNQVSCSLQICVAIDSYSSLMISSVDQGTTWQVVPNAGTHEAYGINAVSCHDSTCIAAGNQDWSTAPLVIMTQDAGKSWQVEIDNENNLPPYHFDNGGTNTFITTANRQ